MNVHKLNQFLLVLLAFLLGLLVFTYKSPQFALSATTHVVISEIQIGGDLPTDEFVELYNPTNAPVNLANWRLAKRTAAGQLEDEDNIINASMSGTIPANGYFLIAHVNFNGGVTADTTYAGPQSLSTNNTILLYDNLNALVDKVGLDSAVDNETLAFPTNPANNRSIERKAQASSTAESMSTAGDDETDGNAYDSDNNSTDFVYRTLAQGVNPQNTSAATETPLDASPSPSDGPTPTPEASVSPSPSVEPSASPDVSPSASPSSEPSPSASPEVSPSATPEASPSVEPSPSASPDVSPSPSPSEEPSPTASPSVSPSVSPEASASSSPEPSVSPSPTPSVQAQVIFDGMLFRCSIEYRVIHSWFLNLLFPHISCVRK